MEKDFYIKLIIIRSVSCKIFQIFQLYCKIDFLDKPIDVENKNEIVKGKILS
jgi:hypothetical protein